MTTAERRAAILQQLHAFDAVLLGVQLKIDIVQQTHDAPVVCLRAVTQIVCEPAHDRLYRQRVLQMEMVLVIRAQKLPCLCPFHIRNPSFRGLFSFILRIFPRLSRKTSRRAA